MAATLTLVKAPALQKVLLLVLLTFGGLGYPPPLAEAIRCYHCDRDCTQSPQIERDCPAESDACIFRKLEGQGTDRGCSLKTAFFDCVKQKMGQAGQNCIEGKASVLAQHALECNREQNVGRAPETGNVKQSVFKVPGDDGSARAVGPPGPGSADPVVTECVCTSDLCNKDQGSASKGASGQRVSLGRQRLQAVIIGGIMLLATNGLFY